METVIGPVSPDLLADEQGTGAAYTKGTNINAGKDMFATNRNSRNKLMLRSPRSLAFNTNAIITSVHSYYQEQITHYPLDLGSSRPC